MYNSMVTIQFLHYDMFWLLFLAIFIVIIELYIYYEIETEIKYFTHNMMLKYNIAINNI
jgi:hypothetical protein